MAHDVRVKKIALINRAGELTGKYRYDVKCKHKGCGELGSYTSGAAATGCRVGHHAEAKAEYRSKNPNDTHLKNRPTSKRVQKKMVKLRG